MPRYAVTALLAMIAAACGDGAMSRPGPRSGIDATRTFGQLTHDDQTVLCDWKAACFGGYGRTMTCPETSVTMSSDSSHSACMEAWSTYSTSQCTSMTVAEYEDCVYNLKCPSLWMAPSCSALADCVVSLMK